MNQAFQIVGLLLLVTAAGVCDQNKAKPEKAPPPPRSAPKSGGVPKGAPPRLVNPANPVTRLYLATPEQRDRVLEKLPPAQQEAMRKHLAEFDELPKEQQQMRLQQAERFVAMPPERKLAIRQDMQALNHLPPGRQQAVRQALRRLQVTSEEERGRILNSEGFKNRFSPEELRIISSLSEVFVPPM